MGYNDDDYEERSEGGGNPLWYAFLITLVATPLTILAVLFTRWLHVKQHIKIKHIFLYGILPYTLISMVFFSPILTSFIGSWTETFPLILNGEIGPVEGVITMLQQQSILSILLGSYVGLIYAYLALKDEPEWDEIKWRRSPYTLWKRMRNIKKMRNNTYAPHPGTIKDPDTDDGIFAGVTREEGELIVQTWKDTYRHTLITGAPGSGKTETLKNRMRDAMRAGQGLVLVDFKGSKELAQIACELAGRYGREFQHWTMYGDTEQYNGPSPNGSAHYDPINRGNSTRRKDLVLGMRDWSEEHYKKKVAVYLEIIFKTMIMAPNPDPRVGTMDDISFLLNPRNLQDRAVQGFAGQKDFNTVMHAIDRLNDKSASRKELETFENIRTLMDEMRYSVAGRFLTHNANKPELNIDLLETARKGKVVVFSLDSNEYEDMARNIANLIIQDMKTITNQLRDLSNDLGEYNPIQLFFDEFASMKSDSIVSLLNKGRDAKVGVTLATQSISDFNYVSPVFTEQVFSNTGTYIIHRENSTTTAKLIAESLSGVKQSVSITKHYSNGQEGSNVNVQEFEESAVSASEIQEQEAGEAIFIQNSNGKKEIHMIQSIMEDPSVAKNAPRLEVEIEEDSDAYNQFKRRKIQGGESNFDRELKEITGQSPNPNSFTPYQNDYIDPREGTSSRPTPNYFGNEEAAQDINYGRIHPGPINYEKLTNTLNERYHQEARQNLNMEPKPPEHLGDSEKPKLPVPPKTVPPATRSGLPVPPPKLPARSNPGLPPKKSAPNVPPLPKKKQAPPPKDRFDF